MTDTNSTGPSATFPVASPGWNRILLNTSDTVNLSSSSSSSSSTTAATTIPVPQPAQLTDYSTNATLLADNSSLVKSLFASRATSSGIAHIAQATMNLHRAAEDIAHRTRIIANELELSSPFQRKNYDYPNTLTSPSRLRTDPSLSRSRITSPPPPPLPNMVKDFTVNLPPAGLSTSILKNKYFQQLVQPHPELLDHIQVGEMTQKSSKHPSKQPHYQSSTVSANQKMVATKLNFSSTSSQASSVSTSPITKSTHNRSPIPHQNVVAISGNMTQSSGLLLSKNDFETIAHLASNILQQDQQYDIPPEVLKEPTINHQDNHNSTAASSAPPSPTIKLQGKIIDNKLVINTLSTATEHKDGISTDGHHGNSNGSNGQRIYLTGYVPRSHLAELTNPKSTNDGTNKENETVTLPSSGTDPDALTSLPTHSTNNIINMGPNRKVPVYLTDYNELREQDRQQQQQQHNHTNSTEISHHRSGGRPSQRRSYGSKPSSRSHSRTSIKSTTSSVVTKDHKAERSDNGNANTEKVATNSSSPSVKSVNHTPLTNDHAANNDDDKDEVSSLPSEIDQELRNAANVLVQHTNNVPVPVPPASLHPVLTDESLRSNSSRIRSRTSSIGERIIVGNNSSNHNNLSAIEPIDNNDNQIHNDSDNTMLTHPSSSSSTLETYPHSIDNNTNTHNLSTYSSSSSFLRSDRRTWSTSATLEIHRRYKEYKKIFGTLPEKKESNEETDAVVSSNKEIPLSTSVNENEDAGTRFASTSTSPTKPNANPAVSSSTDKDTVLEDDAAFSQALVKLSLFLQQQRLIKQEGYDEHEQQSSRPSVRSTTDTPTVPVTTVSSSTLPPPSVPSVPPFAIIKPRTVDAGWAMDHPHEVEKMIQESMLSTAMDEIDHKPKNDDDNDDDDDDKHTKHSSHRTHSHDPYEGIPLVHSSYTDIYSKHRQHYPSSSSTLSSDNHPPLASTSSSSLHLSRSRSRSRSRGTVHQRNFVSTGNTNNSSTGRPSVGDYDFVRTLHSMGGSNSVTTREESSAVWPTKRAANAQEKIRNSTVTQRNHSRSKSPKVISTITTLNPSNAIVPVQGYASFLSRQDAARKQRSLHQTNDNAKTSHSMHPLHPTKPFDIQLKTQERAKARLIGHIQVPLMMNKNPSNAPLVDQATNLYQQPVTVSRVPKDGLSFVLPNSSKPSSPIKTESSVRYLPEPAKNNPYLDIDTSEPLPVLPTVSLLPNSTVSSHQVPPVLNYPSMTNGNNYHNNSSSGSQNNGHNGTSNPHDTSIHSTKSKSNNASVIYESDDTVRDQGLQYPPSNIHYGLSQPLSLPMDSSVPLSSSSSSSSRKLPVRKSSTLASSSTASSSSTVPMDKVSPSIPSYAPILTQPSVVSMKDIASTDATDLDNDPKIGRLYATMAATNRSDLKKLGINLSEPSTASFISHSHTTVDYGNPGSNSSNLARTGPSQPSSPPPRRHSMNHHHQHQHTTTNSSTMNASCMSTVSTGTMSTDYHPNPTYGASYYYPTDTTNANNTTTTTTVTNTTSLSSSSTVLDRLPYTAGLTMASPIHRKKPNNNW